VMADEYEQAITKAIVIDANAFGRAAALDIGLLRRLGQEAVERGMAIWLPEPVLWEAAAHAADVVAGIIIEVRGKNKILERASLDILQIPQYPGREELIEELIDRASGISGVEIIPCSEDNLREALKDQTTERSPWKREKGVKTGASDSAWLRAVRDAAADMGIPYAIVSEDQDVESAFRAWGQEPPDRYSSVYAARESVFGFQVASYETAMRAAKRVQQMITTGQLGAILDSETLRISELSNDLLFWDFLGADSFGDAVAEIVELKSIVGVSVRSREEDGQVQCWMDVATDLNVGVATMDDDPEGIGRAEFMMPDVLLRIPLLLNASYDRVETAEAPWVLYSKAVWDEPGDAFGDCLISLWQVPEIPNELESPVPGHPWTFQLSDGRTLAIESTRQGVRWRLIARIGNESVELEPVENPPDDEWRWAVSVSGPTDVQRHPTHAIGAFVLRKILERVHP
jgi:hypothetical protein